MFGKKGGTIEGRVGAFVDPETAVRNDNDG